MSIRYLAGQRLDLRGRYDAESNLIQHLRSEGNLKLKIWLSQNSKCYASPDKQNEMLKLMALNLLKKDNILIYLRKSLFIAIMVNEMTGVSNSIVLCILVFFYAFKY